MRLNTLFPSSSPAASAIMLSYMVPLSSCIEEKPPLMTNTVTTISTPSALSTANRNGLELPLNNISFGSYVVAEPSNEPAPKNGILRSDDHCDRKDKYQKKSQRHASSNGKSTPYERGPPGTFSSPLSSSNSSVNSNNNTPTEFPILHNSPSEDLNNLVTTTTTTTTSNTITDDTLMSPDKSIKPNMTSGTSTGKPPTLKRVSFGSSKGSMVETLIYDATIPEEPEKSSTHNNTGAKKKYSEGNDDTNCTASTTSSSSSRINANVSSVQSNSKVKVCFLEREDPKFTTVVTSSSSSNAAVDNDNTSDATDHNLLRITEEEENNTNKGNTKSTDGKMSTGLTSANFRQSYQSVTCIQQTRNTSYVQQESTDSGWDNPFRPDGDLSKEADEIVELIKEGKPITPTQVSANSTANGDSKFPGPGSPQSGHANGNGSISPIKNASASSPISAKAAADAQCSPQRNNKGGGGPMTPGVLEVQHSTVAGPKEAGQVEHIVLKKKPKCKCCIVQ